MPGIDFDEVFRKGRFQYKLVNCPNGVNTPVLSRSRNRIGVIIGVCGAFSVNMSHEAMTASGQGLQLSTNMQWLFTVRNHADMPTLEFHIWATGTGNVYVGEIMSDCPCPTGHGER